MAAEQKPAVLIIDDHREYVEVLELSLRDEFSVHVATSGLDGYALACERRPDVVIVDIAMPVVDGWTVLRKFKINPAFAHTPIIVVSAAGRQRVRDEVDPWQVTAVLQKPCDPGQIAAAIRAALAAPRTPAGDPAFTGRSSKT